MNFDTNDILQLLFYVLPALITGGVAYFFFSSYFNNEQQKRIYRTMVANRKQALPLRLQAYERMTLFMERISVSKLLVRISPLSSDKKDYENFLIMNIEQEFEHNLTQQIYLSEECWHIILAAKNTTIQIIRNAASKDSITDAAQLREAVLKSQAEKDSPTAAALAFIRNEVTGLM